MKKLTTVISAIILIISSLLCFSSCAKRYAVHYMVDGVKVYEGELITSHYGESYIKAYNDIPEKQGYIFDGWYLDEGKWDKSINSGLAYDDDGMTVYAKFILEHEHSYSHEYSFNSERLTHYHVCECGARADEEACKMHIAESEEAYCTVCGSKLPFISIDSDDIN